MTIPKNLLENTRHRELHEAAAGATAITIKEVDGTPSGTPSTLEFPNGTITDHGGGVYEYVPASSGAATVVYKSADESVTSSTTLQDDNHLSFSIGASEVWAVRFVLFVDGATAGDFKPALAGPTGATAQCGVLGVSSTEASFDGAHVHNEADFGLGGAPVLGTLGAGNSTLCYFEGVVFNSTTAGTVKLQWAQGTSSGTATKLLKGSYLTAWKIA